MSASCYGVAASDYAWAYNSLSQDPCLVATSLGEACNAAYTIGTIGPGLSYIGPESSVGATACVCSSVLYMMLSACGGCQGSTVFTLWSEYNLNCETIYPMVFPEPIPIEIRVPHWAYANVSGPLGGFNPVDAEEIGGAYMYRRSLWPARI
ncbi:hypothetical protein BT96DRAFT_295880 [Gymnopus androsaceus JB14]|uniref:Uncharacterized protein n=1 Tax=Gymnopus androsaceus JB14 TaxID=1447944 RepID=A0A6A4I650_9AGAR|nr:hypothetical protein BT96DRAFT_295880 [Gymnopus androsaceus JB14]